MGTSASKQMIYIIGPRKLQNEVLASYLEKELDAKCTVAMGAYDTNGHECLILLDTPEKDLDRYFVGLESESRKTFNGHIIALFNVKSGLGIEEKAITWGMRGFFYEQDSPQQFVKGITSMLKGELWYPRNVMTKYILSRKTNNNYKKDVVILTQRELEILTMLISGTKNEDIADNLCISTHTVKTHIYNIFRKISVPNRLQAALWAAKRDIVKCCVWDASQRILTSRYIMPPLPSFRR